MRFSYKRVGPDVVRPIIPVELSNAGISIPYEVLVDSGADICVFDAEIAELLKIPVTTGDKHPLFGATGTGAFMYMHSVGLTVGKWSYNTRVGFSYNLSERGYGFVGQMGFFDRFIVTFDFVEEAIDVKPHSKNKTRR